MDNRLSILLETAKMRFAFMTDGGNILDQKTGTLLGIGVAIGIGYAQLIFPNLHESQRTWGLMGLVFMALSILAMLIVNWPRNYYAPFGNVTRKPRYLESSEDVLTAQLLSDISFAYDGNKKNLVQKAKFYKISLLFLLMAGYTMMISPFISF